MSKRQKIIFAYNANSGFMHSMNDLYHKTTEPNTYPCKLCSLTYSGAFMKKMWREYIANLGIETLFLHKDEFIKAYPDDKTTFPVVLLDRNNTLTTLIAAKDFETMSDLTDLMNLLNRRLSDANKQI